jgi:hypothetical protein
MSGRVGVSGWLEVAAKGAADDLRTVAVLVLNFAIKDCGDLRGDPRADENAPLFVEGTALVWL